MNIVPVGSVILTDRDTGAVAMGPVGFDIGCGMMSARSNVPSERATPDRKLDFNREVMKRVSLGAGVRWWADSPESGPHGWGVRLVVTFLFPK